jgi:hypothetical protein
MMIRGEREVEGMWGNEEIGTEDERSRDFRREDGMLNGEKALQIVTRGGRNRPLEVAVSSAKTWV